MSDIFLRIAKPADFERVCEFIFERNQIHEQRCLHCSFGASPESLLAYVTHLFDKGEFQIVYAQQYNEIVGVIACEYAPTTERGWLWGPFISKMDWDLIATTLYARLLELFYPQIQQLDAFLDQRNERGQQFFLSRGFAHHKQAHILECKSPPKADPSSAIITHFNQDQSDQFSALHARLFPSTYYSAGEILELLDADHRLFLYAQGDKVLGYLFASIVPDGSDAEIEFLGVHPEHRNQGIGSQLLHAGIHWLMVDKSLPKISLTVEDGNPALDLYLKSGFGIKESGINLRKLF